MDAKQKITGPNAKYRREDLVRHITEFLKVETIGNEGWKGLPDDDLSYWSLKRLNKTMLIKIYECFMQL